jgi:hypothetical protein
MPFPLVAALTSAESEEPEAALLLGTLLAPLRVVIRLCWKR